MKRALLSVTLLLFAALWPRADGSRNAALYVAAENGLPTIQSAVDAVKNHDGPHSIMLEAGRTYVENVKFNDCRPVEINGAVGTTWRGQPALTVPVCETFSGAIGARTKWADLWAVCSVWLVLHGAETPCRYWYFPNDSWLACETDRKEWIDRNRKRIDPNSWQCMQVDWLDFKAVPK